MAFTTLIMQNQFTKEIRNAPVGFSWTSFFFGPFVPLLRGHGSGFALWLVLALVTAGLSNFVQMFVYNKMYIKSLISNGFQVKYSPMPVEIVSSKLTMTLPVTLEE